MTNEKTLREELAVAHRLCVFEGFHEGTWNHHTVAIAGRPGHILVTPGNKHWSRIKASDFLVAGPDEDEFTDSGLRPDAYHIHWPIHELGPEKKCVLHVHSTYATALSCIENGRVETCANQTAGYLHGQIAYFDEYDGIVVSSGQGEALAEALGKRRILFLANHGLIVTGSSIAEAMTYLYHAERACQLQVIAQSTGQPLRKIDESEAVRLSKVPFCDSPNYFSTMRDVIDAQSLDYLD